MEDRKWQTDFDLQPLLTPGTKRIEPTLTMTSHETWKAFYKAIMAIVALREEKSRIGRQIGCGTWL